ncbi:cytochrome b [Rhodopila globiformis]|nr:cytochrome b/b6 domain-containing protein [Rhodopila globiformis]
MQPVNPSATRYDKITILFHWLVALLIAVQWIVALSIDEFPKGPLRIDARSVHITGGVILGAVLVLHILWRRSYGRQLRPVGTRLTILLASFVHGALNALTGVMVLLGLTLASARGDTWFNLFTIPSFAPGNKALAEQIADVHGTIGIIILALAALHAAAALFHQFVWKDGVLERMRLFGR